MVNLRKAQDYLEYFKGWTLDADSEDYLQIHCRRYEVLIREIDRIILKLQSASGHEPLKFLDIGPSFLTEILRKAFPEAIVNTIGYEDFRFKARPQDKHFPFDLNDAQYQEQWPKIEKHDLIIMAEVIEHLYTSPRLVLGCIATWLEKEGYLIVQTPNAVSLMKRVRMLKGKHPYEMIRETRTSPGHFREYTLKELSSIGKELGLTRTGYTIHNYFRYQSMKNTLYNALCRVLPSEFREGMTMSFQKG
jgi:trans-aconitate methyltransferase